MPVIDKNKIHELSCYIRENMGLFFPQKKHLELNHKLLEIAKERGFKDPNDFVDSILQNTSESETINNLASKLTVGETYFWRDRELFRTLETTILPELIEKRKHTNKTIRIWSAGCSSGEEPYSIAILLKRLIPDIKDWNITINATDINIAALKKASEGKYTEWSFRSAPQWLKKDYFKQDGKNAYKLDNSIRQMVDFSFLNFFKDVYPSLTNDTNAMDIIFCRNVFIYFEMEDIKNISDKFYNCLVNEGILITTASESFQYLSSRFKYIHHKNVTIYQHIESDNQEKTAPTAKKPFTFTTEIKSIARPNRVKPRLNKKTASKAKKREAKNPDIIDNYKEALINYKSGNYKNARAFLNKIENKENTPDAMILDSRILANEGRLNEALELCSNLIEKYKLIPESYYLKATIEYELGDLDSVNKSLHKTLFLDPEFIMAHFTLGNIFYQQRKLVEANRHFRNTLALLGKLEDSYVIPESDGITVARLNEILNSYFMKQSVKAE